MQQSLILASASPRRQELLTAAGIPFRVVVADVQENEDPRADPQVLVAHNAKIKAAWVAKLHPESLILAADTTVAIDGHVLNKPQDMSEAYAMLRRLSGKTHAVYTAVHFLCLNNSLDHHWVSTAQVTFKPLNDDLIRAYYEQVNPLDKAGAYSIQEHADMIIEHFQGLRSTVIGLPIEEVINRLNETAA